MSAISNLSDLPPAKVKVLVAQLEREKLLLDGQLRNMEWKLDQESKAFYTAKSKLSNAEVEITRNRELADSYNRNLYV